MARDLHEPETITNAEQLPIAQNQANLRSFRLLTRLIMAHQNHPASDANLELDIEANLGESPSWSGAAARLLSVDINSKVVYIYDPEQRNHVALQLEEMVGSVMPTTQPDVLLAALERNVVLINYQDPENPQITVVASTPEDHGLPSEGWRFNDAKAAPCGALIAGRMHKQWRDGKAGRMYSLQRGGQLQEIMTGDSVTLPNGMAWDEGKRVMYFADTAAGAVFSYDTNDGGVPLSDQRQTAFELPSGEGFGPPDGITIDSDGNVWVAMAESGAVAGFSPQGDLLHRVELPVKRPTALTFGGADLATLFVTTRVEPGDTPSAHAGGVFSIRIPGVKGANAAYEYRV